MNGIDGLLMAGTTLVASLALVVTDHITLDIAEGERIGIVGRTGCGKSTLLSAIPRLIQEGI